MRRSAIWVLLVAAALALGCLQAGCVSEVVQAETPPPPQQPGQELDTLVAPIALYPDSLVAQILAAATHPTEVVEADRWLQDHPALKGDALAKAVDAQTWNPAIKALTPFPGLLGMLDKNLSWTSALGEAYVNGAQNVFDAIQVMRRRAQQAGNLKGTEQESVTTQGNTIEIEPTDPQVVYIPEYDPWLVYGDPIGLYPGWVGDPGFYLDGPGIGFGVGIGIGLFGGFGWGWHHWGTDWHGRGVLHGDHPYVPQSREFGDHLGASGRGAEFAHFRGSLRGGSPDRVGSALGMRSSAFSGFNHGGYSRAFSTRGRGSFSGFRGGGAARGGGSRSGGGRR